MTLAHNVAYFSQFSQFSQFSRGKISAFSRLLSQATLDFFLEETDEIINSSRRDESSSTVSSFYLPPGVLEQMLQDEFGLEMEDAESFLSSLGYDLPTDDKLLEQHRWHNLLYAMQEIRQKYDNCNITQIELLSFLGEKLTLADILLEAPSQVAQYFGENAELSLEVDDGYLFAYIHVQADDVDEALQLLDTFDTEWFIDQLDLVGHRFNFNLKFI